MKGRDSGVLPKRRLGFNLVEQTTVGLDHIITHQPSRIGLLPSDSSY